jgi:hypothetical protein
MKPKSATKSYYDYCICNKSFEDFENLKEYLDNNNEQKLGSLWN